MKKLSLFYIIAASMMWGTSGVFFTVLRPFGFSSIQLSAMRSIVAALVICIVVLIRDRRLFKTKLRELLLFAASGIFIFMTSSFYYTSMATSSLSTAVILMYTAPVMVMAVSVAFLGEKLTWLKAAAVVCMLLGCGLVTGIVGGLKFSPMGILTGFLSGVSYAAYNICVKVEMRRGNHPITASAYCFLIAALVSVAVSDPAGIVRLSSANLMPVLPLVIALGVTTCALPYFLYTLALKKLPAGTASALGAVEPMTATILSVVLFHESLGISSVCGIVLILASVVLLSLGKE
ncbi:MAG: DMT family transporter [Clostridia bacterium]